MRAFNCLYGINKSDISFDVEKYKNTIHYSQAKIIKLQESIDILIDNYLSAKTAYIASQKKLTALKEAAFDQEKMAIACLKNKLHGTQNNEFNVKEAELAVEQMLFYKNKISDTQKKAQNLNVVVEQKHKALRDAQNLLETENSNLCTFKSRLSLNKANEKVDRIHTNYDSEETVSMLERMKSNVALQQGVAEYYYNSDYDASDYQIDKILNDDHAKTTDALAELKKKMNILKKD